MEEMLAAKVEVQRPAPMVAAAEAEGVTRQRARLVPRFLIRGGLKRGGQPLIRNKISPNRNTREFGLCMLSFLLDNTCVLLLAKKRNV